MKKQFERLRELERKTQILDEKIREQKENIRILQETIREQDSKIQILQENVTELTHEWKHVKTKLHLGSQSKFLHKYLQAVLLELGFKSEEIAQASTGELYRMVNGTDYNNWRKKTETWTAFLRSVIDDRDIAAYHHAEMKELFDEVSRTSPNTEVVYEKTWDFMAGKYEAWDKWSDLIKHKQEKN